MPAVILPPEMTSIVASIFAWSPGLRYAAQLTMCPRPTRVVAQARAVSAVNDSNVSSSVGSGVVCMWSNSHRLSAPAVSDRRAISTVRPHASCGATPAYLPVQPWGTMTPSFMGAPPPDRVGPAPVRATTFDRGATCARVARRAGRALWPAPNPLGEDDLSARGTHEQRRLGLPARHGRVPGDGHPGLERRRIVGRRDPLPRLVPDRPALVVM